MAYNSHRSFDSSKISFLASRTSTYRPSQCLSSTSAIPSIEANKKKLFSTSAREFTLCLEDFPELPKTHSSLSNIFPIDADSKNISEQWEGRSEDVIKDQFGMKGLMSSLQMEAGSSNVSLFTLGWDLTTLGVDMNLSRMVHPTFGGAFDECQNPPEYRLTSCVKEALRPIQVEKYQDGLLFYLFYTNVKDKLQIDAARELYRRDWRYHIEEKMWLSHVPGLTLIEKTQTYERGSYYFFDPQKWEKVIREFFLEYYKLERMPIMTPVY